MMKLVWLILILTACVTTVPSKNNSSVDFHNSTNCSDISDKQEKSRCMWINKIREMIAGKWEYPEEARKGSIEGTVGLEFSVAPDGALSSVKVVKSSGNKILDDHAVNAVSLAAPFSKPEFAFKNKNFLITTDMRYRLD